MTKTDKDGGPVLPEVQKVKRPNSNKTHLQRIPGIRLRDYFAAHAMQGMLACSSIRAGSGSIATVAYETADAMLAARGAA